MNLTKKKKKTKKNKQNLKIKELTCNLYYSDIMTIMPKVIMIFIFSSCQLNKQEVTTAKVSNVPSKKIVIEKENKKHIRKATISINKDIEVYSIEKQNSLGYKVVVNEKECKFVFSLEYFLQQKSKQNRKLDLQEIKLNIGFYF